MKQGKVDRWSQRTRLQIENALVALVEHRSLDRVSVKEICDRALVSRATFYRIFKDKYHLVEGLFDESLKRLSAEVGVLRFQEASDLTAHLAEKRVETAWAALFEHFANNSRLYSAMLGGKGSVWFQVRMRSALIKLFAWLVQGKSASRRSGEVPTEFARCFLSSALLGLIVAWLDGSMRYSPEQMASWFRRIAYKGSISVLTGLDR
jgi:AcrR family transcriptional regulator